MNEQHQIVVIDFEATCMPVAGSWPIEVALGWPATGVVRSWLIKPAPEWLEDWNWSPASERVHNIPRDMLEAEGIPAHQVAKAVADALINTPTLLSDQAGLEDFWLRCLMTSLPRSERPGIRVHSLLQYLGKLLDMPPTRAWEGLATVREQISVTKPLSHRAGADVAHYVELIRRVSSSDLPTP